MHSNYQRVSLVNCHKFSSARLCRGLKPLILHQEKKVDASNNYGKSLKTFAFVCITKMTDIAQNANTLASCTWHSCQRPPYLGHYHCYEVRDWTNFEFWQTRRRNRLLFRLNLISFLYPRILSASVIQPVSGRRQGTTILLHDPPIPCELPLPIAPLHAQWQPGVLYLEMLYLATIQGGLTYTAERGPQYDSAV